MVTVGATIRARVRTRVIYFWETTDTDLRVRTMRRMISVCTCTLERLYVTGFEPVRTY